VTPPTAGGALDIRRHRNASSAHPAEMRAIRVKRDVEDFDVLAEGCVALICLGHGAKGLTESGYQQDISDFADGLTLL
jgi:hypothetical protein